MDRAFSGEGSEERLQLLAAVMADPVRSKIFLAAAEPEFMIDESARDGDSGITIRHIAELAREPRRRVRYHVDVLCEQGLVRVVDKRRRRGVIERFYRAACLPFLSRDEVNALPGDRRQKILLETLKFIFSDATVALEAGTYMRRPEWAAVRVRAQVDEQGWEDLAAAHERARTECEEIVAAAKKRLGPAVKPPVEVGFANLLFEAAPRSPGADRD